MRMPIDTASGDDHALASDDFSRAPASPAHIGLTVRVAGFADGGDFACFNSDVCFDDTPVVKNDCIGNHGVHHIPVVALRLAHAVADDFAASEFHFFAIAGEVLFDFEEQFGVGQPNAVTGGRTEHFGICLTGNPAHFNFPITLALNPYTLRSPPR